MSQWCDASSLELLGRIIAQSATARAVRGGGAPGVHAASMTCPSHRALAIAREQGARSWFTEGFDARDLKEATALLEEM